MINIIIYLFETGLKNKDCNLLAIGSELFLKLVENSK